MSAHEPRLVCLTPVRNEAWVLERFLRCAEHWADVIVVVDHQSDDGSREIALRHPKVHLVDYDLDEYDDPVRRELLIRTAREVVPGPRVLVALDADEMLVPGFVETSAWLDFTRSAPGSLARMRWINVMPDEPRAWIPPGSTDFAFVDDDREFVGATMHGPRLPRSNHGRDLGPVVLHLQYLDHGRMRSKQRWYQVEERVSFPSKRPVQIYRQYHHMDAIPDAERQVLHSRWIEPFNHAGIDLLNVAPQDAYPTDARVLRYFDELGGAPFRRIDIWDVDWRKKARALGLEGSVPHDPRKGIDRAILRWLGRTQPMSERKSVRWVQRALRLLHW